MSLTQTEQEQAKRLADWIKKYANLIKELMVVQEEIDKLTAEINKGE